GKPAQRNALAATRLAKLLPRTVIMGTPAESASIPVLWDLYGIVSRKRSASESRARWSSMAGIGGAKISLSGATPQRSASRVRLVRDPTLPCGSHRTLPLTARRIRIQLANTSGENL